MISVGADSGPQIAQDWEVTMRLDEVSNQTQLRSGTGFWSNHSSCRTFYEIFIKWKPFSNVNELYMDELGKFFR